MTDTTRTVLIALGVALLVVVLLPILFMSGMMSGMMGGMMGWQCCGGVPWALASGGGRQQTVRLPVGSAL